MKSVLIIDCGNYNSVTTVQINYIKCLLKEGFDINYVIFKDGNQIDEIKYQRWPQNQKIHYIELSNESITFRILSKLIGKSLLRFFRVYKHLKNSKHAICMEYYSAIPAYLYSLLESKFTYQIASLELYNHRSPLVLKAIQGAELITTQDELRKTQLLKYYNIKLEQKVQILYNTSLSWEPITSEKVQLPVEIQGQKIILFIGSLITEHCIEEVIDWIELIDENYCIVFHGWGISDKNKARIEELKERFPKKVWLSDIVLSEAEKWKMYNIADFGVVMFNKNHRNNEFAGLSAGKLFDFMRIGVPTIASKTELLSSFILDLQIGVVYEKRNDINSLLLNLKKIDCDHLKMKFKDYSFSENFKFVVNYFA